MRKSLKKETNEKGLINKNFDKRKKLQQFSKNQRKANPLKYIHKKNKKTR